jgi:MoxR-like ATPase
MAEAQYALPSTNGDGPRPNRHLDDDLAAGHDHLQFLSSELPKMAVIEKDRLVLYIAGVTLGSLMDQDDPGTGKTTRAKSGAKLMGGSFKRLQGSSDVTPADVVGAYVFNPQTLSFDFHEGAVHANVSLGDEFNRNSPKAQAGFLEAMQEKQTTPAGGKGDSIALPNPFTLIATQNPHEIGQGIYRLTKANLDRFVVCTTAEYDSVDQIRSRRINVATRAQQPPYVPRKHLEPEDISFLRNVAIPKVFVDTDLIPKVVDFNMAIERDDAVDSEVTQLTGSRTDLNLLNVARVIALTEGKDIVEDRHLIKALPGVMLHRIAVMEEAAEEQGTTALTLLDKYQNLLATS